MLQLVRSEPSVDGEALVAALRAEEQLLKEMIAALAAQRDAISRDDSPGINEATHGVSRSVLTLDEARRRREQLTQLAANGDTVSLEQLEKITGMIPGLAAARAAVRTAAKNAVRDLALNQAILRGALRAGDAFLQALFASVTDVAPSYSPGANTHDVNAPAGVVVNRRA